MSNGDRLIRWFATFLPRPLAEQPERMLINGSCAVIGLSALLTRRPGSLLALWPAWVAIEWAIVMMCGGLAALVGTWNYGRRWSGPLARVGYLAVMLSSVLYGVGVIIKFGWSGTASGVIFIGIGAAKAIRLAVSSAARTSLLHPPLEAGEDE